MNPILVIDCYLDDFGCPAAFAPPAEYPHAWVRAAHVPLESVPTSCAGYSAIVISGSAACVLDETPWSLRIEALIDDAYAARLPMLGVCYGHQLIAKRLFGAAARAAQPEVGWYDVRRSERGRASGMLPTDFRCFLSHYDEVYDPGAPNFEVLASSKACAVQAFRLTDAPVLGVQFHAEFALDEALELFDLRVAKTPEVVADATAMRALAVDTLAVWHELYARFLARI